MEWWQGVQTAAAIVGSAGVVVATLVFRQTREQARTTFEDSINQEYRRIFSILPPEVFLADGRVELSPEQERAVLSYFDLSNEQLRLINEGRVAEGTARMWRQGIQELMALATFEDQWKMWNGGLPATFFTQLSECMATGEPRRPS